MTPDDRDARNRRVKSFMDTMDRRYPRWYRKVVAEKRAEETKLSLILKPPPLIVRPK